MAAVGYRVSLELGEAEPGFPMEVMVVLPTGGGGEGVTSLRAEVEVAGELRGTGGGAPGGAVVAGGGYGGG